MLNLLRKNIKKEQTKSKKKKDYLLKKNYSDKTEENKES